MVGFRGWRWDCKTLSPSVRLVNFLSKFKSCQSHWLKHELTAVFRNRLFDWRHCPEKPDIWKKPFVYIFVSKDKRGRRCQVGEFGNLGYGIDCWNAFTPIASPPFMEIQPTWRNRPPHQSTHPQARQRREPLLKHIPEWHTRKNRDQWFLSKVWKRTETWPKASSIFRIQANCLVDATVLLLLTTYRRIRTRRFFGNRHRLDRKFHNAFLGARTWSLRDWDPTA